MVYKRKDKMVNIQFKPKNITFVISPGKISIFESTKGRGGFKIINKFFKEGNFLIRNNLIRDNLSSALKELSKKYKNANVSVVLNLPTFFVQKLLLKGVDESKLKDIITTKLKEELPIPLENYIWRYKKLKAENIFVLFFNKEVLNILSAEFIKNKFLPLKIDHIFLDVLNFIEKKFSLYFDKSYIIFIYCNNVVTAFIWESGEVQNIITEFIQEDSGREIIVFKRILKFLKEKAKLPLESVFYVSDKESNFPDDILKEFNIIDVRSITKKSVEEISVLGILDLLYSSSREELELNVIDLKREISLSYINNLLIFWLVFIIIFSGMVNFGLWYWDKKIESENSLIKESIKAVTMPTLNQQEIKNLTVLLNEYSKIKPRHYSRIKDYYDKLSKYKVVQINYSIDNMIFVIEEKDQAKIQAIKDDVKKNIPNSEIKDIPEGLEINIKL
ncbi:MAG: hypothetical protein ACP5JU_00910 [Minisyncoccia bacterium]